MAALPVDPLIAPARVALYGGSFNPPHVGHVAAVAHLLATAEVDAVWVLVCPSHAFGKGLAPLEERVAWCQAAFAGFAPDRVALCTVESRLPQPARTIDTLDHLRATFPQTRFDLAVGADILGERHAWKEWPRLEATTRIVVLGREGYAVPPPFVASPPLITVSSTAIRARLQEGLSVSGLVPAAVAPLLRGPAPVAPLPATVILGAGRLGGALSRALLGLGWPVLTTWSRAQGALPREALEAAALVVVAVSDSAIDEVARQALRPHHVALQLSGALPAQALRAGAPHAAASCHPLQSFDREAPAERFAGIAWGLEGDHEACDVGQRMAEALGGHCFRVRDAEAKALYHAACCVISNGLVALADRAVALMEASGQPAVEGARALLPLLEGTAANLRATAGPVAQALTGPIARGDAAVIAAHRQAIAQRLPDALPAYDQLCAEIARTAARRPA